MAVDFPNSPSVDEQFQVNGRTWKWNGSQWVAVGTSTGAVGLQGLQGAYGVGVSDGAQGFTGQTGLQGVQGLQGFTGANGTTGAQGTTGIQGVSGSSTKTAFKAGGTFYYAEGGSPVQTNITAVTEDRTYYMPLFVPNTVTFSEITCRTGSTFSGTSLVRLGLYNDSAGVPTTVVFDAGQVSCTALSTSYSISISQTVNAGNYWLAFNMQTSPTTISWEASSTSNILNALLGLPIDSSFNCPYGYYQNSVTGAFATAGTLVLAAVSMPLISLEVT